MSEPTYRGYSYGVRHLRADRSEALLDFVDRALLSEKEPPAFSAIELVELGSVYVNDERCLGVSRELKPDDKVRVHTRPRRYACPTDLLDRVVSESDDVLVVDKPSGLPVHALVDNIKDNLISFLEEARGGRLLITHRLDVETSGLVLLAKTPAAQTRLNAGFVNGTIKRTYAAYTTSPVSPGAYVHYMEPTPMAPKRVESEPHDGWLRCEMIVLDCRADIAATSRITEGLTSWPLSQTLTEVYRLEIQLMTGRPQQIRAQLAALGAPIIGDEKYGSAVTVKDELNGKPAIALRAVAVSEEVPT